MWLVTVQCGYCYYSVITVTTKLLFSVVIVTELLFSVVIATLVW